MTSRRRPTRLAHLCSIMTARSQYVRGSALIVIAVVLCAASFLVGRSFERRIPPAPVVVDAPPTDAKPNNGSHVVESSRDENRCKEIAELTGKISEMNWDLVTPFKEFEAGTINAETLRQRTAEPELKILRTSIRMYEIANEIEDDEIREKAVKYTSAVLQRQQGFAMLIEGISLNDKARAAQGAKLFDDGRNKAMAASIELVGSKTPGTEHLQRLLNAYDPPKSDAP